jgi:hypothetical protein
VHFFSHSSFCGGGGGSAFGHKIFPQATTARCSGDSSSNSSCGISQPFLAGGKAEGGRVLKRQKSRRTVISVYKTVKIIAALCINYFLGNTQSDPLILNHPGILLLLSLLHEKKSKRQFFLRKTFLQFLLFPPHFANCWAGVEKKDDLDTLVANLLAH